MFRSHRGEGCGGGREGAMFAMRHRGEFGRGGGFGGFGGFDPDGFDGDDFGGRGRRGRGGRRRVVDGSELRLLLLTLIAGEPRHGYELIRAVEDMSGGAYAPSPGVVYPTLTMLTEMGFITEAESDGARKTFAVTDEGRAELEQNTETVNAVLDRLSKMATVQRRSDGGSVRRAIWNLHVAVRQRVANDELTKTQLHDIAAIIDEAAQAVERY